jgi:hypothetical protein
MNATDFMTVDLGVSQEHPSKALVVEVTIDPSIIMPEFAKAIVEEMYRLNYDKAKQVNLTADELTQYFTFLVTKRVQCVYNMCSDFRQLKVLYIPCYVQFALSLIGIAWDREQGLKFMPKLVDNDDPSKVDIGTFAEMLTISDKLASFESELQLVKDAMPRDVSGDLNFMSTALIGEYVASCRPLSHPATTYVTTFLNMKLKEEATYGILYRRLYGEKSLIGQVLVHEKKLI